ncbi:MAG: M48 family metallopeptidase [Desulfobacterales bacterium]|jgi:Zn-dependent protease with chaperone function|nr:M48 family metallopeptidase [Desulfobacterales bacterium]
MIVIRGYFYDGKTSAQIPANCRVYDNGVVQVAAAKSGEGLLKLSRFELKASARLAHTQRYLYFPQGQTFETEDHRAVDEVLARFRKRSWLHAVHLLESRKRYLLVCLAAMLAIAWGAGRYGVPAVARGIAHHLPPSVVETVGGQTLTMLDRSLFRPSRLESAEQQRLRSHFRTLMQAHADLNLRVDFRRGGRLGANAFALPNGTVIFTDEMVGLARSDDELLAVLAHEAGHVVHRHGVQRIIQDSLLAFAIRAITGDVSGTSELFLGLPVVLTELAYSREFEREADHYALRYLRSQAVSPRHFADLMRRLQEQKQPEGLDLPGRWSDYLSTHPSMEERLLDFEAAKD